jgi:hypothetical protein
VAEYKIFIPGPLNEKERAELCAIADEMRSREAWIDLLMYARALAAPKRKRKPGPHSDLAQPIRDERLVAYYHDVLRELRAEKRLSPHAILSRRTPHEKPAPLADQAAAIVTMKTPEEGRLLVDAALSRKKRRTR